MDIWEQALGFMNSQILLTAEEFGIFDVLAEEPRPTAEIARAVDLPEESAKRLLTALAAMELLERRPDGRWVNSDTAGEKLVSGKPGYIGAMFDHIRDTLYPAWENFEDHLRDEQSPQDGRDADGEGPPTEEVYSDPESLRSFMDGMHTISYEASVEFAEEASELEDVDHVVDVGGASGAFLIALAQRHPHLTGTVLDLSPVEPIATDYIEANNLSDRLGFQACDFFHDPLPEGKDAYSLGFILHDWHDEAGSFILYRLSKAMPSNGLLIIGEYLLDNDRTGPMHVARSDLNMMVAARGKERTAREYEDWIEEFGFQLERIQPTSKGKNFLLARKVASVDAPA